MLQGCNVKLFFFRGNRSRTYTKKLTLRGQRNIANLKRNKEVHKWIPKKYKIEIKQPQIT